MKYIASIFVIDDERIMLYYISYSFNGVYDVKKALISIMLAFAIIIAAPAAIPVTAAGAGIVASFCGGIHANAATDTQVLSTGTQVPSTGTQVLSAGTQVLSADTQVLSAKHQLTTGQKNIVLRARQVYEIEWTPLRNVVKWGKSSVFPAGVTVKGLPYGMPNEANYVPLRTTFAEFLAAVEDSGSRFYTSRATRSGIAPYYSLDCSAFVSWAWGLENRLMTGALSRVAITIGRDLQKMQVGDALNKSGDHVVLVTDIQYDDEGGISAVGIMELYTPQAQYTLYGEGGELPLQTLQRKYLNNGYLIIRCNNRENVVYIHDCAVPLDGDYCDKCISSYLDTPLSPFIDIKRDATHTDAVEFINRLGVFNSPGQSASHYDFIMTRGMFIALLSRYEGAYVPVYRKSPFEDVPIDEWYGKAVAWAANIGIIDASHDRFEPREYISSDEMAVIMYKYFQWRGSLSETQNTPLFLVDPGVISN